jgi:hypothetical protein
VKCIALNLSLACCIGRKLAEFEQRAQELGDNHKIPFNFVRILFFGGGDYLNRHIIISVIQL